MCYCDVWAIRVDEEDREEGLEGGDKREKGVRGVETDRERETDTEREGSERGRDRQGERD